MNARDERIKRLQAALADLRPREGWLNTQGNPDALDRFVRALRIGCILSLRGKPDRCPSRIAVEAFRGCCKLKAWKAGRIEFLTGPFGKGIGWRKSAGPAAQLFAQCWNWHKSPSVWSWNRIEVGREGSLAAKIDTAVLALHLLIGRVTRSYDTARRLGVTAELDMEAL